MIVTLDPEYLPIPQEIRIPKNNKNLPNLSDFLKLRLVIGTFPP